MVNKITRAAAIAVTGITGHPVEVEAAVSNQLPGMAIIGLADTALAEAKQRVRLACAHSGLELTNRFITVNLAPAALPKYGSGFDLAIALTCLAASGTIPDPAASKCVFIGELGLDGSLKHVPGLFAAVLAAKDNGYTQVMVALSAKQEAALVPGIEIIAPNNLKEAVLWLQGKPIPEPLIELAPNSPKQSIKIPDIADIIGQEEAVLGLEIAAAGRHNIAFVGPPGAGKTMLAKALTGILPELSEKESLICSSIAAVSGQEISQLVTKPPFVSPHHTATTASLIGTLAGKGNVQPGDITRAHNGVLFLDETPEFSPKLLDALRQPLETGEIIVQRAKARAALPANFQLVLAANPCPCGNQGDPLATIHNSCTCSPLQQQKYLARISGPLADRIDIKLRLSRVTSITGSNATQNTSAKVRYRVQAAREKQAQRYKQHSWNYNAHAPGQWLRATPNKIDTTETVILDRALFQGQITMRGYDRVLRLAWTIADLENSPKPNRKHIAKALTLRGENL